MTRWTGADQGAAFAQGWGLFETDCDHCDRPKVRTVIQRLDDPASVPGHLASVARFLTDDAARGYVVGRADMGCPLALKALGAITLQESIGHLDEFEYVIA